MIRYVDGRPMPPFDADGNIDHAHPDYHEFLEHFVVWCAAFDQRGRSFYLTTAIVLILSAFILGFILGVSI